MASRLGVDVGGTKIEVVVLDATGAERMRRRTHYPSRDYQAALDCLVDSIRVAEDECEQCSIGVGLPGFIDRESGLLENAFNTPYNKRPLKADLENRLSKEVHFANDANCFALSEAADGAARAVKAGESDRIDDLAAQAALIEARLSLLDAESATKTAT